MERKGPALINNGGWPLFLILLLVTACSTLPLSDSEVATRVEALMPGATAFAEASEREILRRGRPLNAQETRLALAVGVAHPEQVRVWVHETFLEPTDPAFLALAREYGIWSDEEEAGRALGHGVEVKAGFVRSHKVLAHELTHVAQYERMGIPALLRDYLAQLMTVGYQRSPIEAEARANEHVRP
jgi:hypothetical protein